MSRDGHKDHEARSSTGSPMGHVRSIGRAGSAGDDLDDHDLDEHDHDHDTRPTPFEHEHDHSGRSQTGFPHERLDAYRVALTMAATSKRVAAGIPRGHRSVADHMLRAAANVVLLLAEGANRRTPKEKRQRFGESRAECAEVAAAADLVCALELGPEHQALELKHLSGRVAAMLTGLMNRLT